MATIDAKPPRFFRETNEVFAVFGINLPGFIPGLCVAAVFIGLRFWIGVLVALCGTYWLAKRMVKDENYHRELVSLLKEGYRFCVPSYQEIKEPIKVVLPTGEEIPASEWVQRRMDREES